MSFCTCPDAHNGFRHTLHTRDDSDMNQGRLFRVLAALVVSMTVGAVVLMAMEGHPVRPMSFSLSSQVRLGSVGSVLGVDSGVALGHWHRIAIDVRDNHNELSVQTGLTGQLARGYHFVIDNGSAGADGQIFASTRWTAQLPCYTVSGMGTDGVLRICLIGPEGSAGSAAQSRQLEALVGGLMQVFADEPEIRWDSGDTPDEAGIL